MIYVVLDAAGIVARSGKTSPGQPGPDGSLEVVRVGNVPWIAEPGQIGTVTALDAAQLNEVMQAGSFLVPRPAGPQAVVADGVITVSPCPVGTEIEVFDMSGSELMTLIVTDTVDQEESFTFIDIGEYTVEVTPPSPYLMSTARVTVS